MANLKKSAGAIIALSLAMLLTPPVARAEQGDEGCGTVQNLWRAILLQIYNAHTFDTAIPSGWLQLGEPEPNHDNAHADLANGLHNHTDHPTPCGGNN